MGLDSVELVMAYEDHFEVEVPDDDAERIITVGDAHAFILRKLQEQAEDPDTVDPEEVWRQVKEITVEMLAVKPERVTPETAFIDDLGID